MPELREKLCSLSEAAALIPNGTRLALGGFAIHNHPMAFVYELIRRGVKDLTIVGAVNAIELDILIGAGCVKKVETSYVGLEAFGLAPNFRRAAEAGALELREYSEDIAFERFVMSSRGHPFVPTYQLFGTDIPKYNPDIKEAVNPLDGRPYHAIPAAEPDWVVLHAPMGDKYGNVLFFPDRQTPTNLDLILSRTTRNLIVTVEQIVDRNRTFRLNTLNLVPRYRVKAIVEAPYGAHPCSCIGLYNEDHHQFEEYVKAGRDEAGFKEYLAKYVHGVKTQQEYLDLIGLQRLMKLNVVGGTL